MGGRIIAAAMAVLGSSVAFAGACASAGGGASSAMEPVARVEESGDAVRYELGVRSVAHRTDLDAGPQQEALWRVR